jgi:hypothetical protein
MEASVPSPISRLSGLGVLMWLAMACSDQAVTDPDSPGAGRPNRSVSEVAAQAYTCEATLLVASPVATRAAVSLYGLRYKDASLEELGVHKGVDFRASIGTVVYAPRMLSERRQTVPFPSPTMTPKETP